MHFSIIIPVYNRPVPVEFAIRSVLDQSYQDWECIVVDDASTDDTARICSALAKEDSRIRFFSLEKNCGVSAARNYGLDMVTRDGYILFLDSDNCLASHALATLSLVIKDHDADMIAFAFIQSGMPFDPPYHQLLDRTWIRNNSLPQHLNIIPHSKGFLYPYVWNKCYRSSLIKDTDIRFDEQRKLWEDNAFLIQCLDKCCSLVIIPDNLFIPCDYPHLDHLSSHVDAALFFTYISGYEKNVKQFGSEYDYNNYYTPRHFFDVVHALLIKYYKKNDATSFHELLQKLFDNETMNDWVQRITPRSQNEELLVSSFLNRDSLSLIRIYQELSTQQEEIHAPRISWKRRIIRFSKKILGRR